MVVLRKKRVALRAEELELPEPGEPREIVALAANLRHVQRETVALRGSLGHVEGLDRLQATRVWRTGQTYWRLRDCVKRSAGLSIPPPADPSA